jgi:hypothetical protein
MRVTYTDWDDDHHRPISVKTLDGYFEATGPRPGIAINAINHRDLPGRGKVGLSFSGVGTTCDIEIEHEEWAAIRNRIDGLFNQGREIQT